MKDDLESGRLRLIGRGREGIPSQSLEVLGIPVSSQMLVFSATSAIEPLTRRIPGALFSDACISVIFRGRLELALDPDLGTVFIFSISRKGDSVSEQIRLHELPRGRGFRHVPIAVSRWFPGRAAEVWMLRQGRGHGIP
jgi:hypothetical protein